jgi:CDP-2,3-bis-(O-geranylgeranyl)-sn-glycerol synthase
MQVNEFQILFLIIVSNGAPILGTALLGNRGAWPVDGGGVLTNGYRLLGDSKTWRGIVFALMAATSTAWLLDIPLHLGSMIGCFAMLGDMFSSFIKRRLGMASSSMALGLDQIPESLLPLLAVKNTLGLDWWVILELVMAFIILELMLSWILYLLRVRKQPY